MRRIKRAFTVLAVIIILCGAVIPAAPLSAGTDDQTLILQGGRQVYDLLQPGISAFTDRYPQYTVDISGLGDGAVRTSLANVIAGEIDIAMVAREPRSDDDPDDVLDQKLIGRQSIVMIVNSQIDLDAISYPQIKAIYEGTQSDWSELGGSPLVPRAMPVTSGLYQTFTSSSWFAGASADLEEAAITATGLPRLEDNAAMADAIAANSDQIGYIGFGYIPFLDDSVKCLDLYTGVSDDAVPPTYLNICEGNYPARYLYLFYRRDNDQPAPADYFHFILSATGQNQLGEAGGVKYFQPYDLNSDGRVNSKDLDAVGQEWGSWGDPGWIDEDVNQDGIIDVLDAAALGQWWNISP